MHHQISAKSDVNAARWSKVYSIETARHFLLLLLGLLILPCEPLRAQADGIPRTRTLPLIENPAFPYASPESVGMSTQALNDLGDTIASRVADGEQVGAELLIVTRGKTVFHEVYGWSDRESKLPLERNSIFRLRSMTKPVTGTAILMLIDDGKLELDDTIATYLPSFDNERSRKVTVRELLTHTSGLRNHGNEDIGLPRSPDSYPSLRALVDGIAKVGPAGPPGYFLYSDSGSATLGAVVAEISGMPVERFVEQRILDPLGMADSHTFFSPDVDWAERMNSTYRIKRGACEFEKYWDRRKEQRYRFFRATGGLYSTVSDYARFMATWMNQGRFDETHLLTEQTVKAALAPQHIQANGRSYGMHWRLYDARMVDEIPSAFGHGGSDETMAIAFPELDTLVLFFTQSRGSRARGGFLDELIRTEPFDSVLTSDSLRGEFQSQWERAKKADFTETELLESLVGEFRNGRLNHRVALVKDRLFYTLASNSVPVPLKSDSNDIYLGKHPCLGYIFRIVFNSANDGAVNGYRFETIDGYAMEFTRSSDGDN